MRTFAAHFNCLFLETVTPPAVCQQGDGCCWLRLWVFRIQAAAKHLGSGKPDWVVAILGTACHAVAGKQPIVEPHQEHDGAEECKQPQRRLPGPVTISLLQYSAAIAIRRGTSQRVERLLLVSVQLVRPNHSCREQVLSQIRSSRPVYQSKVSFGLSD